jgi:low temperature requirement protein LtrA
MKNGQSIETDNCITTIIYILSFTVTIVMYQAQLINTEIYTDPKKDNKGTKGQTTILKDL